MIDREIKRKIEQKEEISSVELIRYFNQMPAPIEKGLFKKARQKRKEKTHNETRQFLLDNFDDVLEAISSHQLSKFFMGFNCISHKKELFEKMSENTLRIAELLRFW